MLVGLRNKSSRPEDGRPRTAYDVEFYDIDTGRSVNRGIVGASVKIELDAAVTAEIEMYLSSVNLEGVAAEWFIIDPRDGELRKVSRIIFEDEGVGDLT